MLLFVNCLVRCKYKLLILFLCEVLLCNKMIFGIIVVFFGDVIMVGILYLLLFSISGVDSVLVKVLSDINVKINIL